MMRIVGYEGKCRKCGWKIGESPIPQIKGMPAKCEKCLGDMSVEKKCIEDGKGMNFEVTVFCKETGAVMRDGLVLSLEELKLSDDMVELTFQKRACDAFMRIIGASTDKASKVSLKKLLAR